MFCLTAKRESNVHLRIIAYYNDISMDILELFEIWNKNPGLVSINILKLSWTKGAKQIFSKVVKIYLPYPCNHNQF